MLAILSRLTPPQFESYISGFRNTRNFQTSLSGSSSSSSSPEPRADIDIESEDIDLFAPSEITAPLHISRTNLSHIPLFPSPSPTSAEHPLSPKLAEAKIVTSGQYDNEPAAAPSSSTSQPQPQQQPQENTPLPGWKRRERGGSISGGTWEGRADYEKERTEKEEQEKSKGGKDDDESTEKKEKALPALVEEEVPEKEAEKVDGPPVKSTDNTSPESK